MPFFEEIRKWISEFIEIFLLLAALGLIAEILFGSKVPFGGGIIANLTGLVRTLGENGFVGLIALGTVFLLFNRKKAMSPENQQ